MAGVIGSRSAGSLGKKCSLCKREQPLQLGDRVRRVVDPDVDEAVVGAEVAAVLPDHQQGGGLHAALVAAAGLARLERGHQPVRQAPAAPLEGLGQVLHRLVRHHDVGLRGVAAADDHLALPARDVPAAGRARRPARRPSRTSSCR